MSFQPPKSHKFRKREIHHETPNLHKICGKPTISFFTVFCTDFQHILNPPKGFGLFQSLTLCHTQTGPKPFQSIRRWNWNAWSLVFQASTPPPPPPSRKLPCPPKIVGLEDYHLPFWNFVGDMVVFGGISLGVGCFCCVFFCCRAVIVYSNWIHFAKFNIDIFTKPPTRWAPSQSL